MPVRHAHGGLSVSTAQASVLSPSRRSPAQRGRVSTATVRATSPRPAASEAAPPRSQRLSRLRVSGPALLVLALPTALAIIEVQASRQPAGFFWTWSLSCVLSVLAAVLCAVAARHSGRGLAGSWWALSAGALAMFAALLIRGPGSAVGGAKANLLPELALLAPAGPFLVASLLRLGGEPLRIRRLKLLVDVLILGLSPALVGLLAAQRNATQTGVEPTQQLVASAYAVCYTAMAFAILVSVRGKALPRPQSPPGLLLSGVALLSLAALLCAARLLGLAPHATGIGQSFWGVGIGLVGVAAWRTFRARGSSGDAVQAVVEDESRLRLVPSALAGAVVLVIAVTQALHAEPPMEGVFLGSLTLLSLLVGRQMVTLAENRRLLRRVESAGEVEERLRDLGLVLNSSLELPHVLQMVCRTGQDIMRAEVVFLWTLDRTGGALEAVHVVGAEETDFLGRRVALGDRGSIVSRVFRTGAPDIVQTSRAGRLVDQPLTTMLGAQSLLAVPVAKGRRTVGVLLFARGRADERFTKRDLAKAQLLVSHVVFAIENAQLYTQQRQRLEELAALYDFTRGVSSAMAPTTIAEQLLAILKRRPGYTRGRVLLRERETGVLRPSAFDGPPGPGWSDTSLPSEVARRALASGSSAVASGERASTGNRMAVPLTLQDRVVGVVDLEAMPGTRYVATEEELVVSLANQAALAVDNLQLMEEARKLAALREMDRFKTDLLSTVSHELRTPLGSIKGYASTLLSLESKLKREQKREFLQVIEEESDRLTELIENLLDMSRLDAGVLRVERRPVDLEPVARKAVARAAGLSTHHRLTMDWRLDGSVLADPRRIAQVMNNLLENAIKYAPNGGAITLRAARAGNEAVISVSDQGVGIPAWQLERVFERFHRVDGELSRKVGGTGLGLAICRGLIEAHQGRIWAESAVDHGSTFSFSLSLYNRIEAGLE